MSDLTIRPARDADCAAMGRLRAACITRLCERDHRNDAAVISDWVGDGSAGKFRLLLEDSDVTLLVAERQGRIVGFGARRGALVTLNYVDPAQRFTGVGKAVMSALEAGMIAEGLAGARLNSTVTALPFYRAAGWQADGEALPDGSQPMHKRLIAAG